MRSAPNLGSWLPHPVDVFLSKGWESTNPNHARFTTNLGVPSNRLFSVDRVGKHEPGCPGSLAFGDPGKPHPRRYVFCGTSRLRALTPASRTLSGTLPCGVRTFLSRELARASPGSDRPAPLPASSLPRIPSAASSPLAYYYAPRAQTEEWIERTDPNSRTSNSLAPLLPCSLAPSLSSFFGPSDH
jgi:hypothetical protein